MFTLIVQFNLTFVYLKPPNGYLADNEDPYEMLQYAAFHQGLHYLLT